MRGEQERGQPDRAHGQRVQVVVVVLAAHDHLCAAAPDIDEHRLFLAQIEGTGYSQVGEAGFFSSRDHLDVEPCFLLESPQELLLVGGIPRSRRGDREDLIGAMGSGELHELPAHQDRAVHRLRLESPGGELAFTQAGRLALLRDGGVRVIGRETNHQQPYGVRPDVDETDDSGDDRCR